MTNLPPINLINFWHYNRYIRELDDNTIYREYILMKIEEFVGHQESLDQEFGRVLFDNLWDLYEE